MVGDKNCINIEYQNITLNIEIKKVFFLKMIGLPIQILVKVT